MTTTVASANGAAVRHSGAHDGRFPAVLFSSAKDEWSTPQHFYDQLDREFGGFDVDLAASQENTKCERFYSLDRSALDTTWATDFPNGRGWCNPPYSRGRQPRFIAKAADERRRGFLTVMLLAARTDTKAFHAHIWDVEKQQPREGVELRLLKGRLKFGGAKGAAPFPSMVVIFRP